MLPVPPLPALSGGLLGIAVGVLIVAVSVLSVLGAVGHHQLVLHVQLQLLLGLGVLAAAPQPPQLPAADGGVGSERAGACA